MNDPLAATTFSCIEMAKKDPILGITEAFNNDSNPNKTNLGVGVYYDDNGKVPLLECVRLAQTFILEKSSSKGYQPIDGNKNFNKAVQNLIFGEGNEFVQNNKVATVQTLGGTGALKVGADLLKKYFPSSEVWISNPSWENHRAIFETAGFKVNQYIYYNKISHDIDFQNFIDQLIKLPAFSILIFHASCHNPTGADFTDSQWDNIIEIVKERRLLSFIDMAYQGFADCITKDSATIKKFTHKKIPFLLSNSFSKSFSLYGERIGALSVVVENSEEMFKVLSQLKRLIRTNYSSPPSHGSEIINLCLNEIELRKLWEDELASMRNRILMIRKIFVDRIKSLSPQHDFNFVIQQKGMFSYSGLTRNQIELLRSKYSVYAIESGRICVAAINSKNIDYLVNAVSKVL